MKKQLLPLIFSLLVYMSGAAQAGNNSLQKKVYKAQSNAVGFGLSQPVGAFSQSHSAGVGIDYSWSRQRFGKISPAKLLDFSFNGGANFYPGKKITTAGYDFRYGTNIDLYATGGIICNPLVGGNLSLTAGPTLSIYKANIDIGLGMNFVGNYFLSENIAAGPAFFYQKYSNTDALWTIAIRASYIF